MVNRVKHVLDKFIGPFQNGFVPRRQILDVVITTHEVIHSVERSKNPSMALKLDISKACDKVRREFLFAILAKLGFNEKVNSIINNVVTSITFSVIINGAPRNFFPSSQGLHQGDPLSTYLFIIVAEMIRKNLVSLTNSDIIKGIKPASWCPPQIIHQFVDDTFLFDISPIHEAREWKDNLNQYALVSGQCINY